MGVRYGDRLKDLPASGTLKVGRAVASLRAQGIDVVNLGGGIPDPQPHVLREPIAFSSQNNSVTAPAGELDLREAISRQLFSTSGLLYDADTEVVVTVGAKHGVYAALLAVLDRGNEVLVFDPSWVTYVPSVELAGGVAIYCSLRNGNNFVLDEQRIAAAIGPQTRAIILNSPHNPTGRVFSRVELAAVAKVAEEHNLWVLSDESFDKFVFDGNEHVSIAQLPGMKQRTVVLRSFSKAYALPGCRVGYLVGPQALCGAIVRFNEHTISCVSPLMQAVALSALDSEPEWSAEIKNRYQGKRDSALSMLSRHRSLKVDSPEGTFYMFVNIERLKMTSDEVARHLLDTARVGVTPGNAFGREGEGFIRLNLVGPEDRLKVGLQRIRDAV